MSEETLEISSGVDVYRVNKCQAIKLEREVNHKGHDKVWTDLGDALYHFNTSKTVYVTDSQLIWLMSLNPSKIW